MAEGYVKLYRRFEDWEWYKDINTKTLFIHCLINANYEEKKWKGMVISIGSFITSSLHLAEELSLTRQQIRRAIFNLQTTNEIAIKTTNKATIISVLNWAKYQVYETNKTTNKATINLSETQPTNNQQTTTTKELKEIKNKEVVLKSIVDLPPPDTSIQPSKTFVRPTLEDVKAYCLERNNNVNADKWIAYYESNGWKVGKNSMKNWKAAVRTWEIEDGRNGGSRDFKGKPIKPEVEIGWLEKYVQEQQTK